jgi:predicted alpha-1,2-mannosidase
MSSLLELVNPRIGISGSGHCLVGPYMPLGLVRVGPDSFFPQCPAGYKAGQPILGFSHLHLHGNGGSGRYGNIRLTPFCGEPQARPLRPFLFPPHKSIGGAVAHDEVSRVGYYAASLEGLGVRAELTCTHQVGVHRYTFSGPGARHVMVDVGACVQTDCTPPGQNASCAEWDSVSTSIGGFAQSTSNRVVFGRGDFRGGWGFVKPYSVHFYLRSRQPFEDVRFATGGGLMHPRADGAAGEGCMAMLRYGPEVSQVELEVGISFVSVANAQSAVATEVGDAPFDEIRSRCEAKWLPWLSRVRVQGGSPDEQTLLYTSLYHLFCAPADVGVDHENPYWKSGVRQYTDFYCLWDSIRNANSLWHLMAPELSASIMNALLDIAEHFGWLPDAYIAFQPAYQQSAAATDILFSEAMRKGVGGVDYARALHFCRRNAEVAVPDPSIHGRYLENYHKLGYVSTDSPKSSVSRHLEYTYHDWCIGKLAESLGQRDVAERFRSFAGRLWNLWRDDKQCFWPRLPDGQWIDGVNPDRPQDDSWNDPYTYEASLSDWTMNSMHDFHGFIRRVGGPEKFVEYLDSYFARGLFFPKETKMHIPHLYTYAGRPDKAADAVRKSLAQAYGNRDNGLPDNEDMGCQSGYYICNSIGLYPIYGQEHYMIVPPLFDRVELDLGTTGKTLTIVAPRGGGKGLYIREATLNGQPLDRAWVRHEEIRHGGELRFVLADEPAKWGTRQPPPNGM